MSVRLGNNHLTYSVLQLYGTFAQKNLKENKVNQQTCETRITQGSLAKSRPAPKKQSKTIKGHSKILKQKLMRLWPAEKAQLNSWRVLHANVQLEHVDPHGDVYGPARVERHACACAPPQPAAMGTTGLTGHPHL